MKIFNEENKQLVAYIQRKDLKALIRHEERLPRKIYKLAKELGLSDLDETHDEDFIRTTDKKFIKLLLKTNWILDYRDLRDLTDEELQATADELVIKIQDMGTYYNSLSYQEQRQNYLLPEQYAKTNHKLKDLNAYLWTRQGKYPTPVEIPLAIDSKAGIVSSNGELKFGRSLDHKKILIAKKDGTTFQDGYHINPIEINMGLMIIMAEENLTPSEPGQMDLTIKPEPTKRFLIAEYSFTIDKDYVPPVVEEKKEPTRLRPQQKIKTAQPYTQTKKDEN